MLFNIYSRILPHIRLIKIVFRFLHRYRLLVVCYLLLPLTGNDIISLPALHI